MPKAEVGDTIVIYHSHEEGGWIAHGLRTDQLGIAATPVDALAQLIRLLNRLIEEAALDNSISTHREAPFEIQAMANRSNQQLADIEFGHSVIRISDFCEQSEQG